MQDSGAEDVNQMAVDWSRVDVERQFDQPSRGSAGRTHLQNVCLVLLPLLIHAVAYPLLFPLQGVSGFLSPKQEMSLLLL